MRNFRSSLCGHAWLRYFCWIKKKCAKSLLILSMLSNILRNYKEMKYKLYCIIIHRTSNLPWMIKKLWHHHPRLRQNYHHHQLHHQHQTERINDPSFCYRLMEHRKINHQNQIVHQVTPRLYRLKYRYSHAIICVVFSRLTQKIAKKSMTAI